MTAIDGSIVQEPEGSKLSIWLWLHEWATTADHKKLGLMYIGSGLLFFVIAGLEASMMRMQLALPNNDFLTPETFNRLMTVHGTTMVFFVGMPVFFGFGNYLVPLMIGARDLAFPRLNAFGFWLFLFGGLLFYFSWIGGDGLYGMGTAPDVGWFAYSPLTSPAFAPGNSTDYWILGIMVAGFGSTATALNFVATIICMRCPGMTLMKMPLFVWLMLVNGFLVLVALTPLTAAQVMLLFDRFLGSHFFDTQAGGDAVLWQHFFWVLDIRRSTSSSFRRLRSRRRSRPYFRESRSLVMKSWSPRRSESASSASGSGRTTCSRWGSRPASIRSSRQVPWRSPFRRGSRSSTGSGRCGAVEYDSRCRCCGSRRFSSSS